jgi:hypothetical protein
MYFHYDTSCLNDNTPYFIEEKYLEKSSADGDLVSKPNRG